MSSSSPSAQIGRYGTISLMKRQDPSIPLTAFGIDTPELTFGRDPSCAVRLYYAEIAVVHSRIVFDEDRKAFMCVLGESGVTIDGCFVKGGGEMIPLMNGSEFEIRGKRFRFSYPPKEIRAALYASPIPTRAPRLSLITSTHVFSPRPSPDPRENLRILKSPLKNTFKTLKRGTTPLRTLFANASSKYEYNSPVKTSFAPPPADEDEEEDNIVLVDGNHPRVVEDEKDLVILEDIDRPVAPSISSEQKVFLHAPQPQKSQQEPPKTPVRRRSQSLHRAVLIRSAQRAVMKAERDEREREEEEMEEMEVLDVVAGLDGENNGEEKESDDMSLEQELEQGEAMDVDMDFDMEEPLAGSSDDEQQDYQKRAPKQKLTWRKSFERLWPFRSSSPVKDEEDHSDDEEENENENEAPMHARTSSSPTNADDEDENEDPAPLFPPLQTPLRPKLQYGSRALGPFMTPQPRIGASLSDPTIQRTQIQDGVGGVGQGRLSLGGGEARRVVAESQVWRVKDIVVPPPSLAVGGACGVKSAFASPVRPGVFGSPRKVIDDDERKAIQERRRSALREPSGLGFVPGLSPVKIKNAARDFSGGAGSYSGIAAWPISPMKSSTQPTSSNLLSEEKEEEEDTRRLLDRMRETVEGMKRRRSEIPPPQVPMTPRRETETEIRGGRNPVKKGEVFTLLRKELMEGHGEEVEEREMKELEIEEITSPKEENEEKSGLTAPDSIREVKDVCRYVLMPINKDEEPLREKPRSISKATLPALTTHQEEEQCVSTVHKRGKSRSKSKARSPTPACVQEAEAVSPQPVRKPRSKSKAKAPAPVRVQEDKGDVVVVKESHSRTDEHIERAEEAIIAEPEEREPVQVEKQTLRPRSRSKTMLASNGQTISEPKELVQETKVRGRKVTTTAVSEEAPQPEEAPKKRGRKAATTPAAPTSSGQDEPAPTRRGRKPTADPKHKEAPKRGRKLGVTTAATALSKETPASVPMPVVENEEPVKRGRTPRAGSVVPTSKPTSKTVGTVNGDDGKKVTVKGRKRAGTIRKEDNAESGSGESVNASMTTITTIANGMGSKARTPAVGTRTRRTPASAPALPVQDVNKENENDEEGEKVRISRKGRGKKEDDEIVIEAGAKEVVKAIVRRTTRTRTRT